MAMLPPTVIDSISDLPAIKVLVKTLFNSLAEEDSSSNVIQTFDEDFQE